MPRPNASSDADAEDDLPPAVGLIPAAGKGTRVSPLPCSKELFPVGAQALEGHEGPRARVASQMVLEGMKAAGIETVYWVLREGKWDIPEYWGDGERLGMNFAYLMMRWPFGVPFTLDQAYPFVQDQVVLLGFPDLLFQPKRAYRALRRELAASDADIVLGCFPAEHPEKVDVVDRAPDGTIKDILIKPEATTLTEAWIIAAWRPSFTFLLHDWVTSVLNDPERLGQVAENERHLGHLFKIALAQGLNVRGVTFSDGAFTDIGTPEELQKVLTAEEVNVGTARATSEQ